MISLLFMFAIIFLVIQFPFDNDENQIKQNNNTIENFDIFENTTHAINSTFNPQFYFNNTLSTVSTMDGVNKNKPLFTIDQTILQDKILDFYIKYPILIKYTFIQGNLEMHEENHNDFNAEKIKKFNQLKEQLKEEDNSKEEENMYCNFYNDLINQHEEITKLIHEKNMDFTNMKSFHEFYIELTIYKNISFVFRDLAKPPFDSFFKIRAAKVYAKVSILYELDKLNKQDTVRDSLPTVDNLIRNVLLVLVETKITTEDIKNKVLRAF